MKKWLWMVTLSALLLVGCAAKSNTLNVEMNEFGFVPDRLIVKAGVAVTLNLKNSGTLEHDLIILEKGQEGVTPFNKDSAGIFWQAALDARQETTLQFTAPTEAGEYHIVCGVPGHLEQGMQATLVVEP